jgi:hypothetical protein
MIPINLCVDCEKCENNICINSKYYVKNDNLQKKFIVNTKKKDK